MIAVLAGATVLGTGIGLGIRSGLFQQGQYPVRVTVPSPTPALTPIAASSPTEPSPSPTPRTSVVARLHGKIAYLSGDPLAGGWITFPGGVFARDPASGADDRTHDLALNRWLPVTRNQVSPDGTKYAYLENYSTGCWVRVVWSRGDSFRVNVPDFGYPTPCAMGWMILSTADTGVYLQPQYVLAPGLWWAPFFGKPRQITDKGYWTAIDSRYAYGSLDWQPEWGGTVILRLDLSDGSTTPVFWMFKKKARAVGVDGQGQAVIVTYPEGGPTPRLAQAWVAGPNSTVMIYQALGGFVGSVVADRIGVWLTTHEGLCLYSSAAGLEVASPIGGVLASGFRPLRTGDSYAG